MNQFHPDRPDDPVAMSAHHGRFYGGKALAVLGGPSGQGWATLRNEIKPDVIITANGATRLPGADYWLLTENMNYCHNLSQKGHQRLGKFLHVFDKMNTAKVQLVSHRSWNLLHLYGIDLRKCISIRRKGYELDDIPQDYTLREYGQGFMAGGMSKCGGWQKGVKILMGTVGMQLLHLAGILGCAEVHTVGFDLTLDNPKKHHWYKHPTYEADRFRTEEMFVDHKGVTTKRWWIETAQYLKSIEYLFERDGLLWRDHSNGLLKLEGLQCTL